MKKKLATILLLIACSTAMAKEKIELNKIPAGALQSATSALARDGKEDMTLLEAYNTGNKVLDVADKEVSETFCLCSFSQIIFQNSAGLKCSVTVDEARRSYKVLEQSCQSPAK